MTIVEEERHAKQEERARERQRINNAYRRVFLSEDGRDVLNDLRNFFGTNLSTAIPTATRPGQPLVYDSYYTHIRSGQRDVVLHIEAKLASPSTGDANIEVLT